MPARNRRPDRSLKTDMRPCERLKNTLRKIMPRGFFRGKTSFHTFPFNGDSGRLYRARGCICHFRPDSVARNERDPVCQ